MRLWEFTDNLATPQNMVLEQDFILHIRRLKRLKAAYIAANVKLSEITEGYKGMGTIEETHRRVQSFIQSENGAFAPMANGDIFLTWEVSNETTQLLEQVMQVVLPDSAAPADQKKYMQLYKLPDDYAKIRAVIDEYVNPANAPQMVKRRADCVHNLASNRARGMLSAWTVSQIESLVKKIDIHHYLRSQPIFSKNEDGTWERLFDETYISFGELKQKYFEHTDVTQPKHLFLELCQFLDSKVLSTLTENYDSIKGMKLSLNLSVSTILGVEFAAFTHTVKPEDRKNIGFEIHCGDLLQDFEITLNMLETLRKEGFMIAIDGVTLNMLSYFNFALLNVDDVKIDVRKDFVRMLDEPYVQKAIQDIGPEKIIFARCDSDTALQKGLELGITKFQGFHIDDLVAKEMHDGAEG